VEKVEEVRDRRAEALDLPPVELPNSLDQPLFPGTARARVEELPETKLVLRVLVDVRDPELGLPQERVVGPLEDLPLFRDRTHDGLERRALVDVAEDAGLNLRDDRRETPPDRAEVLETLLPEEPRPIGGTGVRAPAVNELPERIVDSGWFRSAHPPHSTDPGSA
jgi:hypothetical protein